MPATTQADGSDDPRVAGSDSQAAGRQCSTCAPTRSRLGFATYVTSRLHLFFQQKHGGGTFLLLSSGQLGHEVLGDV